MYASQVFWFFVPVVLVGWFLRRKKVQVELGVIYGTLSLLFLLPITATVMNHFGGIHFIVLDAVVVTFGVYQLFKWLHIAMKGWWIVARLGVGLVLVVLIWTFLF